MKKRWFYRITSMALALCLLTGCAAGKAPEKEESAAAEEEQVTLRWAIVEEEACTMLGHENEPYHIIGDGRISKFNALLQQKGYPIQVEMEYILHDNEKSELEQVHNADTAYDLITFQSKGIEAEEMAAYLLPLEEKLQEGGKLQDAGKLFSEQIWQYDQIEGHTYNLGILTEIWYPKYEIASREELPEYDADLLEQQGDDAVPQIAEQLDRGIKMAEPYMSSWGDELGVEYRFRMIAPGVGLSVENGTEFENVWESEEMNQLISREMDWIASGVASNVYERNNDRDIIIFQRKTTDRAGSRQTVTEGPKGNYYSDVVAGMSNGHLVPTLDRNFTSVLQKTPHPEACMRLLSAVNTDQELFDAICTPTASTQSERICISFYELCNYQAMLWDDQTLSSRVAELSESQISPVLGFAFDAKPVQKEVEALQKLVEEDFSGHYGSPTMDAVQEAEEKGEDIGQAVIPAWQQEYEKMKAAYQQAGIDRVIEEANRQLFAWRESRAIS